LAWFAAWSNISRRFGFQLEALLGPCHSKLAFCLTAKVRSKSAHGTDEAGVLFYFRSNGTTPFLMCLSTFSTKHFNGEIGFIRQTGKNRADSQ
jgi:hypothetical protein